MRKRIAIFTGCYIPAKLPYLEKISIEILNQLDINPRYLEFSCCPNLHVKSLDIESWLSIAARNLSIAEKNDVDIIALCPGCSGTLKETAHILKDNGMRERANMRLREIGMEYKGNICVEHIIPFLYKNMEKLKEMITFPLNLRVAIHDGCHIQRPSNLNDYRGDYMNKLIELTGCEVVDYDDRDLCCGAAMSAINQDISTEIAEYKLKKLNDNGIDILCTPCPICFLQYDLVRRKIDTDISVFYYPELLALAIGIPPKTKGMEYSKRIMNLFENKNKNVHTEDR